MCLVSICFSIVLTRSQIWLVPWHALTEIWKSPVWKIIRFPMVSDKKSTANQRLLNARSQQSFRVWSQLRTWQHWPTHALTEGKQKGRYLPPDAVLPAPAACQSLCSHCLLCKHCMLPIPALHLMVCKAEAKGWFHSLERSKCTLLPSCTSPIILK